MDKDGVYQPDRTIKDVYEEGVPDKQYKEYQEIGISPYARIGSLADTSPYTEVRYRSQDKPKVNRHNFTYVGPLEDETLSPNDRHLVKLTTTKPYELGERLKMPALVIAAIAYVRKIAQLSPRYSRQASTMAIPKARVYSLNRTQARKKSQFYISGIPLFAAFVAVLLLMYSSIIAPTPMRTGSNGQGNSYTSPSETPSILDNQLPFQLSSVLGIKNSRSSTAKQSSGNQAVEGISNRQYSPATTPVTPSSIPNSPASNAGSVNLSAPPTANSVAPAPSTPTIPTSTSTPPTTSQPVTGPSPTVTIPSTPTTQPSGPAPSVPGVTSPTTVSTPTISSPLNNKPLVSGSLTLN